MINKPSVSRLLLIALSISILFGVGAIFKARNQDLKSSKQNLSEASVRLFSIQDSTLFSFPKSSNILLIFFNSECHYCWKKFDEFEKNKDRFSGIEVIFFSIEPISKISSFISERKLIREKNFHFVKMNAEQQAKVFGYVVPPTFFIYHDAKLMKELKGNKKLEEVLKEF